MKTKRIMVQNFRSQVQDDIALIKQEHGLANKKLNNEDFAFNFWILDKIYNVDEELILGQITEGKDFAVDCWVHYEDTKELFIIQNKYYDVETKLVRQHAADFLLTPLSKLDNGTYTKSKELNDLFQKIKSDPEYKINLHFYLFNDIKDKTIDELFWKFNATHKSTPGSPIFKSDLFYLKDIYNKYYFDPYEQGKSFNYTVCTNTSRMIMQILPDSSDYGLPNSMIKAFYVMMPVIDVYKMYHEAIKKQYPIFRENIREYLGTNPINDGIQRTLESDPAERLNFFYYNNGMTIICDSATPKDPVNKKRPLEIVRPQIVNGCQTVNTIYEVLKTSANNDPTLISMEKEYGSVFVMAKVLVKRADLNPEIFTNIVKYTNKQNALPETAFTTDKGEFNTLQKLLEARGYLLLIKASDQYKFEKKYSGLADKGKLLKAANENSGGFDQPVSDLKDVFIPFEKLLQVYLAFMTDGYHAFTKKPKLLKLKASSKDINYYVDYSLKINDNFIASHLIKLWTLFKRAERERNKSEKTPIPYYVIGFLGYFLKERNSETITPFLNRFFGQETKDIMSQYDLLCDLTANYKIEFEAKNKLSYNEMIKKEIDNTILISELAKLARNRNYEKVKEKLDILQYE